MRLEQMYTGCLAHAAYYLESNGEVALFDPLREVQPYIDRAAKDNAKIKYVFETHFHADFVSGHLNLAQQTGATIVYGPTAKPGFEALVAEDNQWFEVGKCKIKLIHTPGHTMESSCFLVLDEEGKELALITGDTLFIGDVGRPDLAQHVIAELTQDKLARHLYHSLREKIMPLSNELIVFPNHGAGSACGKMMSKETTDTLGNQKRTNYALDPKLSEDDFVAAVLNGLAPPPQYFPKNVLMNINGYDSFTTVMGRGMKPYDAVTFETIIHETNVLVLDTRKASDFAAGFIPNSINIGLDSNFAMWVGEIIEDLNQRILIVAESNEKVEEAIIRLSRVGYDHTIGYLDGGFESWSNACNPVERVGRISAKEVEDVFFGTTLIIDVRKRSEYESEHLVGAVNIPLNEIKKRIGEFPKEDPFIIYCAGGYRSMVAASLLKQRGYHRFVDVEEGFVEIKKTSMPRTAYICPSTLL
ncbi:MBL fold metallo-hydrolase [Flavobacterium sp. SUN046]|uniref:MBL fold metallo-hydrolase n=1 Tax=Flavobacterium sp. SUN046 TaxID=3002440 RepID=UPI002DBB009E|nr:MBL fold metallo-hydrolase [Flavobacterium sp. SUN046]MEC4048799.1 MBL fold metallo-hydrolase [Flavobacterium sp. SUN046]